MKNIKCRNCFFYRNEWCEKIVDSPDPEEARDCNYFREMTNADRIRAMSDEELAEVLSAPCLGCVVKNCRLHNYGSGGCTIAFLKWLQQPAKEAEHESV